MLGDGWFARNTRPPRDFDVRGKWAATSGNKAATRRQPASNPGAQGQGKWAATSGKQTATSGNQPAILEHKAKASGRQPAASRRQLAATRLFFAKIPAHKLNSFEKK